MKWFRELVPSRKTRQVIYNVVLSAILYFSTKYASPSIAEDVLWLIGLLQIPFGINIYSIAREDAALKSNLRYLKSGANILALLVLPLLATSALAQSAQCVQRTGQTGHLIVPAGVWNAAATTVKAYGTDGDCVGEGLVSAAPSLVTMWGYDEYAGRGLRANEPIRLAAADGDLSVRLATGDALHAETLRWRSDMIAVASMVAPADTLFQVLDSLDAAISDIQAERAVLQEQLASQSSMIDSLQLDVQALIGERDAALALLAPVRAERDSLAQVAEALETERAELAIRVDEQATTIESATQRVRLILEGMR